MTSSAMGIATSHGVLLPSVRIVEEGFHKSADPSKGPSLCLFHPFQSSGLASQELDAKSPSSQNSALVFVSVRETWARLN